MAELPRASCRLPEPSCATIVRESLVEQFCTAAAGKGREIVCDTSHVRTADSIIDFARRIGRAERVYIFLSETYLQKWYCMLELLEVWKRSGMDGAAFSAKTRIYVMPGLSIKTEPDRIKYARDWNKRYAEYDALMTGPERELVSMAGRFEYHSIARFRMELTTILAEVQDRIKLRDFDEFVAHALDELD